MTCDLAPRGEQSLDQEVQRPRREQHGVEMDERRAVERSWSQLQPVGGHEASYGDREACRREPDIEPACAAARLTAVDRDGRPLRLLQYDIAGVHSFLR